MPPPFIYNPGHPVYAIDGMDAESAARGWVCCNFI